MVKLYYSSFPVLQRCWCASLCSRRSCLEVGWATFCTSGVFLLLQWAVCSPLAVTAPLCLCSYTKGTPFSLIRRGAGRFGEAELCVLAASAETCPILPEMEGREGEGIRGLGNSRLLCALPCLSHPCSPAPEPLNLSAVQVAHLPSKEPTI